MINQEHESFIKDFLESIEDRNAAIFAGAGLSVGAGYVDWKGLLEDIASEIGLDINKEDDLVAVAQYHYNENRGRSKLNKKIMKVFTDDIEETENHRILSRLPIDTYWTTNYDKLIENSLEKYGKIVDVKHQDSQLPTSKFKRDAVVYKLHGDVDHPADAIITRDDYEQYFRKHEPFINALQGDLTTKTFLFIGFSFNDPNLEYALSRVRLNFGDSSNHHYCFIRRIAESDFKEKADYDYHRRRQELRINDLRSYQINPVIVDSYNQVTEILDEIEKRSRMRSIFISGSAEEYGEWGRDRAVKLVHKLSSKIISKNYRVVNGFGWGIGSAVINGALERIHSNSKRYSEEQLVVKPFPQFASGEKDLPMLWKEYRERMISFTGISIYLFGNKLDPSKEGNIILAYGVQSEFEIALSLGTFPIPIGSTGYMAKELWQSVIDKFQDIYGDDTEVLEELRKLQSEMNSDEVIKSVIQIIETLNKK